ncbi:glutathione transferase omega-1 [Wolfiporia cocos MD-104 SS10]|uniref:Glutathione transferase omega-1 n=1 Tax=Wolfiporia cocos (strain MD-104) TaxID=742152 RepID=A0A2H3J1J2_WOLCO|nr:glutathione transferase omega-1 [Wolfiporia cocos MD-104 SS10]
MNSYPPELLAQLAPVMFVGGLDIAQATGGAGKPQDPFAALLARLRDVLVNQRKAGVWQPEKNKTFQVAVVDKDVRFPPRKLVPSDDPQYHVAHSPLSPLTPTSPLYPDGLIAPIWIRKHTTLIPAVFVVFMRLYEHARAPLDTPEGEREREAEERRRDNELCADIAQRKRTTSERGVKLTVVLLASRRMLDDPTLDNRLTYIRRQSGLDPRAALFVLSPVPQSEIGDFVNSLQEALYEPALEYYTNHSKRVRRKRNKHSQSIIGSPSTRPLRPEGWTVRYEYKMACFAEFRSEDEVALKHYQDAYSSLLIMFGSTAILPPRTKRWAEAKVLADCINLKICKLYLYNNEHALALSHHNTHMRKFADFSRGWGIGDETYEFWSWLARQHRALAELLEHGTRSTLKIPTHFSTSPPVAAAAAIAAQALDSGQRSLLDIDAMRVLGLNPQQALQHPGFYYYMAARCTERRRERFLTALDAEAKQQGATPAPGFANEKKVDHLALVLELYTRSYELFKAYSPASAQGHGRLTLWIAYRIAQTYFESGKFDMAVRFFERIAKTYRREKWDSLLQPLLTTWYSCAQQMGDMELSVRLLFEMLGHEVRTQQDDVDSTQEDLIAVLKSTVPTATEEPFAIDSSESVPILDSCAIFWQPDVIVGESCAFQLSLTARQSVSLSSLPFSSLAIHFSADMPPVTVRHAPAALGHEIPAVQRIDVSHISASSSENESEGNEAEGNLRWGPSGTIVVAGSVSSDVPTIIKITKLVLTLQEEKWRIEIALHPSSTRHAMHTFPHWLTSSNPVQFIPIRKDHYSSVTVRHRPHKIQVSISYNSPAYLGEEFPIVINVTNADDREMDVVVDALLQPTEVDEAEDFIRISDQRSTSLVKGVSLGIVGPGVSTSTTLYLASAGSVYDRVVDISIQSRAAAAVSEPASPASPGSPSAPPLIDRDEVIHTLTIPAVAPISVEQQVVYRRSLRGQAGLADLRTYEDGFWNDGDAGEAVVTTVMVCAAPSGVVVEAVKLVRQDGQYAKVIDSSVDQDEADFLSEWLPGDEMCDRCRVSLAVDEDHLSGGETISGPGTYEVSWRRLLPDGGRGLLSISRYPLPPLRPSFDELIALLDTPPTARLHVPVPLNLIVRNRHPERSANVVVQLETDSSDGFIVTGLRSGRLPIILPGGEERLMWKLIPVDCGFVRVPRIKVLNRRTDLELEEGEVVRVVDVRQDERSGVSEEAEEEIGKLAAGGQNAESAPSSVGPFVLVLP